LGDEKLKATAGKASGSGLDAHLHRINLEDLIIHRYSEHDALFKRADKAARALIEGELRDGEGMRVLKPGVYQVFCPKLTPEAGSLRCAVIAEQVAREVRDINPTSRTVDRQRDEPASRGPKRMPGAVNREPPAGAAHHEAGTRAIALMAEAQASEDISLTGHDKATLGALRPAFHPVWHTKNSLITGYYCTLTNPGAPTTMRGLHELLNQSSEEIAGAKVDATMYRHAADAVQYLLKAGLKALLIVPIRFSTVDRLKYMTALLGTVGSLPPEAQNLLVFELTDIPRDVSRFRLREPVSYLRTRARALLAQTGFEPADLELYKEAGFHGISADIGRYDWKESQLIKGFERFVEGADSAKLQSFIHGVNSKSLAVGAIAAGARYMDGPAVAEPIDHPKHIRPYEIDMLYEA
jgi:hypothetical protein